MALSDAARTRTAASSAPAVGSAKSSNRGVFPSSCNTAAFIPPPGPCLCIMPPARSPKAQCLAAHIYLSFPDCFSDNRRFRCQVSSDALQTRCCIVGGGPAGMMLGFLLARARVEVLVLEKHADFLRDFRGDTIHPSTLELMYELGLLEEFLKRPHQEVRELRGQVGSESFIMADFRHLPTHCKFLAFMPQWDFLTFIAEQASRYPTFHLIREAEVIELIQEGAEVKG